MTPHQELAAAAMLLVEKAQVPATMQNARTVTAIHEMLSQIAQGHLILELAAPKAP